MWNLGGDRATAGQDSPARETVVGGHLAAAGHRIVGFGQCREEQLPRRDAEGDHRGQAAVVRHHDVAVTVEREGAANA